MTRELSALLDGEIEPHEAPPLWSAIKADKQLRATWGEYQLISDALRGETNLSLDITSGVMAKLTEEPIVIAPPATRGSSWQRSLLAVAASMAGIAVVGWLALAQQPPVEATKVARVEQPATSASSGPSGVAPGMQEYLLAHQANAPGLHLQGGAQHIRTVSAVGRGQ